jgi:hypothetical protein
MNRRSSAARADANPAGTSTGRSPAVSTTLPPQKPGRHGWADLLALVGVIRRLAFDSSLPPVGAIGRIRDAFHDYDEGDVRH